MRSRVFCVLLGLAMGWTGASAGASYPDKDSKEPDQTSPPYTTKRVIARQKGHSETCPTVPGGWTGEPLTKLVQSSVDQGIRGDEQGYDRYGYSDPALADKRQNEKPLKLAPLLRKYDLDRFCVYTTTGSAPFPTSLPPGLEKADPDRMALTPTAPADLGAIGNQTWPTLADKFLDQVGKIRLAPATAPSVRLVFVDTHRTGEGPPDPPIPSTIQHFPSWHGHAMAHLGHEIVCGHDVAPANCAVHVATRLALRYDKYDKPEMSFSPDPGSDEGGHLGLVSDLGVAILAELEDWQNTDPDHRPKLVLNLSVGWDGEEGNDLSAKRVADLESSSRLVYDALRVAAQLDVLVIASAGNRTGGQESTSPLLPAGWELRRPSWLPLPICKVVYAVGGIDWQGLSLPSSRPGGRPWRVAYGDHGVARTSAPSLAGIGAEEPTKMYTGTSVSTAVVSSIAAVTWYLRPDLKPAQVMKLIGHAGEVLDNQADFYAWQRLSKRLIGAPHLRRLSLCQTVLRICGPDERLCRPKLETLDCRLSEHSPADLIAIQPKNPTRVPFKPVAPPPDCDSRTNVYRGPSGPISDPRRGCPMEKVPDMTTPYMVSTQPPENPCPACTAVPDPPRIAALALTPSLFESENTGPRQSYGLAVGLDPDWKELAAINQTQFESAVLVIDCPREAPIKERFDITTVISPLFEPLGPKSVRLSFDKIDGRKSLAGCTASVDFKLKLKDGTERSVQSPVYVDP